MSDHPKLVGARCDECGAAYRVSNPDRSYACKACGGSVVASLEGRDPEESHEHDGSDHRFDDLATCQECQAVNHPGAHFCAECSAVLDTPPPRRSREATEEESAARHETARALKSGYRWMLGVTWLYRIGALAYAAVTTVAVVALMKTEVPETQGIIVVSVMSVLTVAMLIGALQIPFRPFVWTLTVAVCATLATLSHVFGPNPLGLAVLWSAVWAVLFWVAVLPTLRMQRLIHQHTDEYILHHASLQTRRALSGRSPEQRHERLLSAMHRAAGRAWKLSLIGSVAVVVMSALGTKSVLTTLRPQEFAVAQETFERAWNTTNIGAIGALLPVEIREQKTNWLKGISDGHGWTAGLPPLSEGVPRDGDLDWIDYKVGEVTMSAGWALQGLEWSVLKIELPTPSLQPSIDSLVAAWKRSDAKAIADFFPNEYVERYLTSINEAAALREWSSYPELLGVDVDDQGNDALVTLRIPYGEVATKWRFRVDGTWGMQGIEFPGLRAYRKAREKGED